MQDSISIHRIATKYLALSGLMDERMSRQWAAAEATAYGWGGVRAVSRAIGMSPHTIRKGLSELAGREANPHAPIPARIRRPGGGRKSRTDLDPGLELALESLVDPATRGDPQSPLRWTCKSTTRLAEELTRQGHPASPSTVGRLLRAAGYNLQGNRKDQGGQRPPGPECPVRAHQRHESGRRFQGAASR